MTLSLVKQLAPASAYCFKYSPRDSTESASRPDDCAQELKEDRLARLNEVVDRLTKSALDSHLGRKVQVLNEQAGFGRTREGFKTRWQGAPSVPGTLTQVRITGATRRTLLGEIDER